MHRPARLWGAVVAGLVAPLIAAAPAWAHAEVEKTSPQPGGTVHGDLKRVSVTFDEAVTLVPHALRLTTDRGIPVNLEKARLTANGTVLSAHVQDHLASGHYAVAWRVQSDDGHLESSTFSFTVVAADRPVPAADAAQMTPLTPPSPDEPLWPVLVAAAIALVGGLGAGVAVHRGLRLVRAVPIAPEGLGPSGVEHDSLRLPM